jgi:hypothetical protein
MNYTDSQTVTIVYIASNLVGLLFLMVACRNTKIARLMFVLLFAWASWINYTTCRSHPEFYLAYRKESIAVYSTFINGWFSSHVTAFVTMIALSQAMIATGMLLNGNSVRIACAGTIAFLIGIAPLGLYAAFPFSITVSTAAFFVLRFDDKDFLWNSFRTNLRSSRR